MARIQTLQEAQNLAAILTQIADLVSIFKDPTTLSGLITELDNAQAILNQRDDTLNIQAQNKAAFDYNQQRAATLNQGQAILDSNNAQYNIDNANLIVAQNALTQLQADTETLRTSLIAQQTQLTQDQATVNTTQAALTDQLNAAVQNNKTMTDTISSYQAKLSSLSKV